MALLPGHSSKFNENIFISIFFPFKMRIQFKPMSLCFEQYTDKSTWGKCDAWNPNFRCMN